MNYKKNIIEILSDFHDEVWRFSSLEVCYGYLKQNNLGARRHELKSVMMLSMTKHAHLAKLLYSDIFTLKEVVNNPVYKSYKLSKKTGGYRTIDSPDESLKLVQRNLNNFLQSYYLCVKPHTVHGFIPNFSQFDKKVNIVENAKVHVGKKYVLNLDLKDFFDGISASRIKDLFVGPHFKFNEPIANALTLLVSYQGKLPTGAPTSPVISNFICLELDQCLMEFSRTYGLTYTRYADDLTFSSNKEISDMLLLMIKEIIQLNTFKVNNKKIRIKSSARQQLVTGLVVNKKVNIDRKLIKQVRAMLHHTKTKGLSEAAKKHYKVRDDQELGPFRKMFLDKLLGYINFIGLVRGEFDSIYLKFKKQYFNFEFNSPTIYQYVDF